MSVEWFFKLKEIDSLNKMRSAHLKTKSEQEDRVSALNQKRQDTLSQTTKLKQDLIATNTVLADLESKMKVLSEQKQRLLDYGGDESKIAALSTEINALEEQGLETLDQIETIESELADNKTFCSGIEKTIQEIETEVNEELSKINQEILNLELRLKALTEELPDNFRMILNKVSAKNLAHGPFTRIEQGSCFFCRYKISRMDESEIDMQKGLKTCPQCSRIFLPYGA